MSRSEMTVTQYRTCEKDKARGAEGCDEPARTKDDYSYCNWGYPDRDDHPINGITWYQPKAFAAWYAPPRRAAAHRGQEGVCGAERGKNVEVSLGRRDCILRLHGDRHQ